MATKIFTHLLKYQIGIQTLQSMSEMHLLKRGAFNDIGSRIFRTILQCHWPSMFYIGVLLYNFNNISLQEILHFVVE